MLKYINSAKKKMVVLISVYCCSILFLELITKYEKLKETKAEADGMCEDGSCNK